MIVGCPVLGAVVRSDGERSRCFLQKRVLLGCEPSRKDPQLAHGDHPLFVFDASSRQPPFAACHDHGRSAVAIGAGLALLLCSLSPLKIRIQEDL